MDMKLRSLVALLAVLSLAGEDAGGGLWARVWRHEGFQAFSRGTFGDSGSNIYVSRRGRIQLINRLDLNRDGHVDLFVANGHGHSEDEDAYVYLNNGQTIDPLRRIAFPTDGAVEGLVADLDRDGVNDVVVVNGTGGTTNKSDSFIYYGAEGRFPVSKRRHLRSWSGKEAALGDWNRDGWTDLAIACANPGPDKQSSHSVVYWNSAHGFDPDRWSPLAGPGTAVLAADLAGDEALDLILAAGSSVFVYAAGEDGLDLEKPLVLDLEARHLGAGDLDRDGRIELVAAVESGVQVRAAASGRFQVLQRLPVENPWQVAVRDLNRDGLPDLAVTSSDRSGNGYTDSLVFWNRDGRLSETDPTPLATVHARGVSAGDLNGDGWPRAGGEQPPLLQRPERPVLRLLEPGREVPPGTEVHAGHPERPWQRHRRRGQRRAPGRDLLQPGRGASDRLQPQLHLLGRRDAKLLDAALRSTLGRVYGGHRPGRSGRRRLGGPGLGRGPLRAGPAGDPQRGLCLVRGSRRLRAPAPDHPLG